MHSTLTYVLGSGDVVISESFPGQGDVLLVDLADTSPRDAGNIYRRIDPALRMAAKVVFRGRSAQLEQLLGSDPVLLELLAEKQVGVISPKITSRGFAMEIHAPEGFLRFDEEGFLAHARAIEVRAWLAKVGAVLEAPRTHFVLPSGIHASSFIQATDLAADTESVDRLVDWICPFLTPTTALLSDTPGLISLLYALRLRALEELGWSLAATALDGYPVSVISVARSLERLKRAGDVTSVPLLVLSTNSSGRVARIFRDLAPDDARIIALVHTRPDQAEELDDFFFQCPVERWEASTEGECSRCGDNKKVFIDRRTLIPIPEHEYTRERPKIEQYGQNRDFWVAVSESCAVRLHADAPYGSMPGSDVRHHPIFIDVRRLLQHDEFRAKCVRVLQEIPSPDVVLIPRHSASEVLVDLAKAVFGPTVAVVILRSGERFGESLREIVTSADRVLVMDDVVITGSTVVGIKNEFYRVCQLSGHLPALECFVVVCRPSSRRSLINTSNPFRGQDGSHFRAVESIFLPAGTRGCPWCEERELLRRFLGAGVLRLSAPAQEFLENRIRVLAGEPESLPIIADATKLTVEEFTERLPDDLKTLGSFFGELDEGTAFAAACSVIQDFTDDMRTADFFVSKVADVPFFIRAFFDVGLLAGIIRTLKIDHVRLAGYDEEVSEAIRCHPAELAYPGIVAELALGAAGGKIPARPVLDLIKRSGSGPALELLGEMILRQIRPPSDA